MKICSRVLIIQRRLRPAQGAEARGERDVGAGGRTQSNLEDGKGVGRREGIERARSARGGTRDRIFLVASRRMLEERDPRAT